jgi:hypothetical protein
MKGIDIKIQGMNEDQEAFVHYDQPRVPKSRALPVPKQYNDHVKLQNEYLLSEADRPSGFKQKTKALFKSDYYPVFHFDVLTSCPQHLYIGQPMVFEIAVRVSESMCTAPMTPAIKLGPFKASISAQTQVRAEKRLFSSPESEGNETVLSFRGLSQDSEEFFTKANDYTKIVTTKEVAGIPSSFSTYNIMRSYMLEVEYTIVAAEKATKISRRVLVALHPPVESDSGSVVAGSSRVPLQEADGPLPEYERPPEYNVLDKPYVEDAQGLRAGKGKAVAAP